MDTTTICSGETETASASEVIDARWLRRNELAELKIGWQFKDFRMQSLTRASETEFIAHFRPKFRLIRMLVPLFLRRSEMMGFDCFIRMAERAAWAIMNVLNTDSDRRYPALNKMNLRCRRPIKVNARTPVTIRVVLKKHSSMSSHDTFVLELHAGLEDAFKADMTLMLLDGYPSDL